MAKPITFVDGQILTAANLNLITPDVPAAGDPYDTGWVDIELINDFEPQGSSIRPSVRRIGLQVFARWGINSTNVAANSNLNIGLVPVGFRPAIESHSLANTQNAATQATGPRFVVTGGGNLQLRTGAVVTSNYYLFSSGTSWFVN